MMRQAVLYAISTFFSFTSGLIAQDGLMIETVPMVFEDNDRIIACEVDDVVMRILDEDWNVVSEAKCDGRTLFAMQDSGESSAFIFTYEGCDDISGFDISLYHDEIELSSGWDGDTFEIDYSPINQSPDRTDFEVTGLCNEENGEFLVERVFVSFFKDSQTHQYVFKPRYSGQFVVTELGAGDISSHLRYSSSEGANSQGTGVVSKAQTSQTSDSVLDLYPSVAMSWFCPPTSPSTKLFEVYISGNEATAQKIGVASEIIAGTKVRTISLGQFQNQIVSDLTEIFQCSDSPDGRLHIEQEYLLIDKHLILKTGEQFYNPPQPELYADPKSGTASWIFTESDGGLIDYTSYFSTLEIDGVSHKALVRSSSPFGGKKLEYFIQGFGLVREESFGEDGKPVMTKVCINLDEFNLDLFAGDIHQKNRRGVCTGSNVNMRSAASTKGKVVGQIKSLNDQVFILDYTFPQNSETLISQNHEATINGTTSLLPKGKAVQVLSQDGLKATVSFISKNGNTQSTQVPLSVLETHSSGWYLVRKVDGTEGWVFGKFIEEIN